MFGFLSSVWTKVIIGVAIITLVTSSVIYFRHLVAENTRLSIALESSETVVKNMEDDIERFKLNYGILQERYEIARDKKARVIERVITLDNRKQDFIDKKDTTFETDVSTEFTFGLKSLSCSTGDKTSCKKLK